MIDEFRDRIAAQDAYLATALVLTSTRVPMVPSGVSITKNNKLVRVFIVPKRTVFWHVSTVDISTFDRRAFFSPSLGVVNFINKYADALMDTYNVINKDVEKDGGVDNVLKYRSDFVFRALPKHFLPDIASS